MRLVPVSVLAAVILLFGIVVTGAEKDEELTGILFVNAADYDGKAFFLLDGGEANADGFPGGYATGWVQFPAGEKEIEVEHQPLGKVVMNKELKAGSRQAFIAYKVMEDQSAKGRPLKPTIGVFKLACDDEEKVASGKRRVVLVNTTMREEVAVQVGDENVMLKRLKPETVVTAMGGGFIVVKAIEEKATEEPGVESEVLALATLNVEEPIVSYVVIYEKAEGGLGAVTFAGLASRIDEQD